MLRDFSRILDAASPHGIRYATYLESGTTTSSTSWCDGRPGRAPPICSRGSMSPRSAHASDPYALPDSLKSLEMKADLVGGDLAAATLPIPDSGPHIALHGGVACRTGGAHARRPGPRADRPSDH